MILSLNMKASNSYLNKVFIYLVIFCYFEVIFALVVLFEINAVLYF